MVVGVSKSAFFCWITSKLFIRALVLNSESHMCSRVALRLDTYLEGDLSSGFVYISLQIVGFLITGKKTHSQAAFRAHDV